MGLSTFSTSLKNYALELDFGLSRDNRVGMFRKHDRGYDWSNTRNHQLERQWGYLVF